MAEESPVISEDILQLYRDYAGIKDANELSLHLINIQTRLATEGKINYRCIQKFKFAFSRIYHRFFYKKVIEYAQQQLAENEKPYFLDIGCCTGTDLRKLLLDGYPRDYLIGMDIEQGYIDCGHALFKDSPETCPIQLIVDDLFKPDCQLSKNQMAVIHAGSVFHLFNGEDKIREFLQRLATFLKPGGLLVGGHVCADRSTEYFRQSTNSMKFYLGIEDFKQLLINEGFTQIEVQTRPRLCDEEAAGVNFQAFWISFCAVYNPSSI